VPQNHLISVDILSCCVLKEVGHLDFFEGAAI
jgi:hypothetical protein